ncbi:sigma 54 modulation/S30EA ribosomal C-terminal domain-containing protein [Cryptosporangium sp. NPDC048952]|uniref:sigma 54 modulation/S30EA ribosomal C-terminal domain-containing protein n=1 Tax=Cryptosporangium sp. NPDC048952 TaxID=3363961 RepID=UPI0037236C6F
MRVHTLARSARKGLDELFHKLRAGIERLDRHHAHHAHRAAGQWHMVGGRAAEDRAIHHRGTYAPMCCSVDEAVFDLDALGREFHLFHDVEAEQDSVVYRIGDNGYRLARVQAGRPGHAVRVCGLGCDRPGARADRGSAAQRLACSNQRFVFFVDRATGCGAVLHTHADGDYGLIALD